jgi:hypothetical protein
MADSSHAEQAVAAMQKIVAADTQALESVAQLLDPETDRELIDHVGQLAARYHSLYEIVAQGVRYGVMSFDRVPKVEF